MGTHSPAGRRRLIRAAGVAPVAALASALQARALAHEAPGALRVAPAPSPYGPLAPAADRSTGLPLLHLPAGFTYASYGWRGDRLDDGAATPDRHDGMGVIATRGRAATLVRNHECGVVAAADAIGAAAVYDDAVVAGEVRFDGLTPVAVEGRCGGGTTTLRFDGGRWRGAHASLGGTLLNCAGGVTPWGTWLSCEETLADLRALGGRAHGYVFEVGAPHARAEPIVGMGRMMHEAAAVDPASGDVYLTEDNRNLSALYRYRPADARGAPGSLHRGGRLQAARIRAVLRRHEPLAPEAANDRGLLDPRIGDEYEIEWVDLADPDASPSIVFGQPGAVLQAAVSGPARQALAAGCARFSRGEGAWCDGVRVVVVDTSAGTDALGRAGRGNGAVWELSLATMRLRAAFASGAAAAANNPDNVVASPRGGLLLCEDGGATRDADGTGSRLLGLDADGRTWVFARNAMAFDAAAYAAAGKRVPGGDARGAEFCGACFDDAGRTLFVNLQSPGVTFAIEGPWSRGPL